MLLLCAKKKLLGRKGLFKNQEARTMTSCTPGNGGLGGRIGVARSGKSMGMDSRSLPLSDEESVELIIELLMSSSVVLKRGNHVEL